MSLIQAQRAYFKLNELNSSSMSLIQDQRGKSSSTSLTQAQRGKSSTSLIQAQRGKLITTSFIQP